MGSVVMLGCRPFITGHGALRMASARDILLDVLRLRGLRSRAAAGFAFAGLPAIHTDFTVVYLAGEPGYWPGRYARVFGVVALPAPVIAAAMARAERDERAGAR